MRILLVKTSSLGDVVHNLPVVSDIARSWPDAQIDWVVEESFADIPPLHPAVSTVIPVALRRWRNNLFGSRSECCHFIHRLRQERYDAVIDTQGLIKSALISRLARVNGRGNSAFPAAGRRYGHARSSAREPLAALFYQGTYPTPRAMHAVLRNRELAAAGLAYRLEELPLRYGIRATPLLAPWLPGGDYALLLTAASRPEKCWPEEHWVKLATTLHTTHLHFVLPWGSEPERLRALRIAARVPHCIITPALSLTQAAQLIAGAQWVVGVDTGLTHLSVALQRPTLALYCATDSKFTGVLADSDGLAIKNGAINLGAQGAIPTVDEAIRQVKLLCPTPPATHESHRL